MLPQGISFAAGRANAPFFQARREVDIANPGWWRRASMTNSVKARTFARPLRPCHVHATVLSRRISRALTSAALGLQTEIVAGVLQDRHRAVLGVRAVLVKAPCRQSFRGAIRLTTAHAVRPPYSGVGQRTRPAGRGNPPGSAGRRVEVPGARGDPDGGYGARRCFRPVARLEFVPCSRSSVCPASSSPRDPRHIQIPPQCPAAIPCKRQFCPRHVKFTWQ